MRLFYSFQLPQDLKESLFETILDLKSYIPFGVNWVDKENLHITFQFVGNIKPHQMADLEEIFLASIENLKKQTFQIENIEVFPLKLPRQIWLSLSNSDKELEKTSTLLRTNLRKIGINLDNFKFLPHITLGRIKSDLIKPQIEYIFLHEIDKNEIHFDKISLIESNLSKKGPQYRILKNYNLT